MVDSDSMICNGAKECELLKDAVNVIYYGSKRIEQRPEHCSGRSPHRYNHEECDGMYCPFIKRWVKCEKMFIKNPVVGG